MELVDDEGVPWNPQAVVREQVAKVRSSQPAPMFGCTALQRDVTSPRARFASLQMENSYGRILLRVKVTRPPEDIIEPTFSAVRSTPTSAGGAMPGLDDGEEDAASSEDDDEQDNIKAVKRRATRIRKHKQVLMTECLVFFLYAALFVVILYLRRSLSHHYFMTRAVSDTFVEPIFFDSAGVRRSFKNVTTLDQTWGWLEGTLLHGLYPPTPFYPGDVINYSLINYHMVAGQFALVGAVRLKQWRVMPETTCAPLLWPLRSNTTSFHCYGEIAEGHEDTRDFGPNADGQDNVEGFSIAADNTTEKDSKTPGTHATFPSHGFVVDLATYPRCCEDFDESPFDREYARMSRLHRLGWLDAATRGVSIAFTLYNGNTKAMISARMLFEVSHAGRVVPTYAIDAFDLDPMLFDAVVDDGHPRKTVAFVCQIFLYALFVLAVKKKWEVLSQLRRKTGSWPTAVAQFIVSWHTVDVYVLSLFMVASSTRFATYTFSALDASLFTDEYVDFWPLARYTQLAYKLDALTLLGCTLKVAKYLQLFEGAEMISSVFSVAAADLGFALLLFVLLFYGFANMSQQMFGATLVEFKDTLTAGTELLFMVLGKMTRSNDLFDVWPLLGPIFLLIFLVFVFFTLNSLFLAVLAHSFTTEREKRDEQLFSKKKARQALHEHQVRLGIKDLTLRERAANSAASAKKKTRSIYVDSQARLRKLGKRKNVSRLSSNLCTSSSNLHADLQGIRTTRVQGMAAEEMSALFVDPPGGPATPGLMMQALQEAGPAAAPPPVSAIAADEQPFARQPLHASLGRGLGPAARLKASAFVQECVKRAPALRRSRKK